MLVLFLFTLYHIAFVLAITSCYIRSRGEAGRGGGGGGGGFGGVGFGGGVGVRGEDEGVTGKEM